jgi:hypothetical protein
MQWADVKISPPQNWEPADDISKVIPSQFAHYVCLVCGYSELTKPYGDYLRPSYEICPTCGYQYGYHDYFQTPINYRKRWIDEGANWWAHGGPIESNWNARQQLKRLDDLPRDAGDPPQLRISGLNIVGTLAYF